MPVMMQVKCDHCGGSRLNSKALQYRVLNLNINELMQIPVGKLLQELRKQVVIAKAGANDKIGDISVNYENNFKTYQAWRDELTRPLEVGDKLRRPQHIKRPAVPLSNKAYAVNIK